MAHGIVVQLTGEEELERLKLPRSLDERLQALLDKQDRGESLTESERTEAEGLVELAEFLSLLRLRAQTSST